MARYRRGTSHLWAGVGILYIMKTSNIYYIDIDPNYPVKMFFKTEKRLFAAGIFLGILNTLLHIVLYKYKYINDFSYYVRNIHYLPYIRRPAELVRAYVVCRPLCGYTMYTFIYTILIYYVYVNVGYSSLLTIRSMIIWVVVDLICTIYIWTIV